MPASNKPLTRWQTHVAYAIFAFFLLYLAFSFGLGFHWMRTQTPLPLWSELVVLLLPGLSILVILWFGRRSFTKGPNPRFFAVRLGIIALVLALLVSQHYSKFWVLASLYGYSTVESGQLHFISTEKNTPWVVSNGDHVKEAADLWAWVNGDIFAVIFFTLYLPVYHFLPERKPCRSTQITFTIYKRKRWFSRE